MKNNGFSRRLSLRALLVGGVIFTLSACRGKNEASPQLPLDEGVPKSIVLKLESAGFDTSEGLQKFNGGYLVEKDLFFTQKAIDSLPSIHRNSKVPQIKHYRSNFLITGLPRIINVYMDTVFGATMLCKGNAALARYNNLNLAIKFKRVYSPNGAQISIRSFFEDSGLYGYTDGYPTSRGEPAGNIMLNTHWYNKHSQIGNAETVIAHEIGHAIGFRHTDFMDRAFSNCEGGGNEGGGLEGAVHVVNTPDTPTFDSWMLACIFQNSNRPFTNDDKAALLSIYRKYDYPEVKAMYLDGIVFKDNTCFTVGSHILKIYTTAGTSFINVKYGNLEVTSQEGNSYCLNYGGGEAAIYVVMFNGYYQRLKEVDFTQK